MCIRDRPPLDGVKNKFVTVENITTGEVTEFSLERNCQSVISIIENGCDEKQEFLLSCESEPLLNSSDTRELGFVLVDEIMSA